MQNDLEQSVKIEKISKWLTQLSAEEDALLAFRQSEEGELSIQANIEGLRLLAASLLEVSLEFEEKIYISENMEGKVINLKDYLNLDQNIKIQYIEKDVVLDDNFEIEERKEKSGLEKSIFIVLLIAACILIYLLFFRT